jgi:WD40 repeat protein
MASVDLQEKANFTRLSRLLVDKGTEALRNTLYTIHSSANLPAVLNANITSLQKLKPRVINATQWDLLFPSSGNPPDSRTFDITLLMVLLRNICTLLPAPSTGWSKMPPDKERTPQANITRIKLFRNELFAHVTSTQMDKTTFENLWKKMSRALVDLNIPQQEINDLKTDALSTVEKNYVHIITEWVSKEEDFKNTLEDCTNKVEDCKNTVQDCTNKVEDLTRNVELVQKQQQDTQQSVQQLCQSSSRLREEDSKQMLVGIQQHLNESKLQQQDDSKTIKTYMQHLAQIVEENRSLRQSENEGALLQQLAKHNFKSKIRSKVKLFHPGTRDWLLKKVENWFRTENESRLLLITAGPGFGKSVFAAKVGELFKEKEKLAACHFCDFGDSNLKDPMMMLESLASHMSENFPGFKEKLLDQLKRPHKVNSLKDAFQIYLQNPLDELELEPRLIVIDGLDESATDDKSDMVKLIANHFPDLPKCVKVLITSRPELSLQTLERIQTIHIGAKNEGNGSDLLEYLKDCLPSLAARDAPNASTYTRYFAALPEIVKKCEGSFLYAFFVHHELGKREDLDRLPFEEIMSFLPNGMGSVYHAYFHRLEVELEAVIKKKPDLFKLLELLVAVKESLPLTFVARILELDLDCRETKRTINDVNEAVSCLLYVSNDMVTVFHKSVYDWLLGNGYDNYEYTVKISDGKKRLWQVCAKIFIEIKQNFRLKADLKLTNDVKHALEHGHKYLMACMMKESIPWLVDMVIVHVQTVVHPKRTLHLQNVWEKVLRSDVAISLKLRQSISWHLLVFCHPDFKKHFSYLEVALNHSPVGLFPDDEKKIAEALVAKAPPPCVKRISIPAKTMSLPLAKLFSCNISAVGVSSNKNLAAVALKDGTVCALSLPNLVELWQYSTGCKNISCCTFAPDGSFVLYGKLETALKIAEKKEISFFNGTEEMFKFCAFSSSGDRLVTNDGSSHVKIWDVVRKSLLTVLCAGYQVDVCHFSSTGLFIIAADRRNVGGDSYCVWNSITFQRVDQRSLCLNNGRLKSERCERCFRKERKELIPCKELGNFTGIHRGVECIFYLYNRSLRIIESTHFTTLEAWQIFVPCFDKHVLADITMIDDHLWLHCHGNKMIVFGTVPLEEDQSCLSRPACVLWCSFSPDGTRLATCTSDDFINLWNVHLCKVYQSFRSNYVKTSSAACWWSDKYLFVCHLNHEIPSLSKYPVGKNFKVTTTQRQIVPLCRVLNEFLRFSKIINFSHGCLILNCGGMEHVKVLDVNRIGHPQLLVLPGIDDLKPTEIAVSAGAAFVVSTNGFGFSIWKKNEAYPACYEVHVRKEFVFGIAYNKCSISHDSKYVAFFDRDTTCIVIDMDTGSIKIKPIIPGKISLQAVKLFCTNRVIIRVVPNLIYIYYLESSEGVRTSYQRNLTEDLVIRSKLSPKGNIIAVPRLIGDMDFLQVCIPESCSVSPG